MSDLQPVLRQLSDSLTALGPALERNDLPAALAHLDAARQSADRIGSAVSAAADTMSTLSLIRSEFGNVADSSADLREHLTELREDLTEGTAQVDRSSLLQTGITAFDTSMERLSKACSNYMSGSPVAPTSPPVIGTAK